MKLQRFDVLNEGRSRSSYLLINKNSVGPIRRNSSCLEAGDLISPSQRNSVLRAVAAPGTR